MSGDGESVESELTQAPHASAPEPVHLKVDEHHVPDPETYAT